MTVLKKQFEIGSKKVWVRQASGMERLKYETILAKTFRKFRHFGPNNLEWTEEQQEEFLVALESAGGAMEDQIRDLVPPCLMDETDLNHIDRDTLMDIFDFVRGNSEEPEGAVPLDS
jgi:hypothetical protein|tara:strand:- start:998 stop:1348 length:351 start_codon:yes stop_codon:yes gene_type:complete